jgi:sulfur carrier protein
MQVRINHTPHELPASATVADAVALLGPTPPFAVAVNMGFVPQAQYAQTVLCNGDQVEIIRPVTGG